MADAIKLLPCPFCGEQPIMADNRQTGGACFVQCQTCDAETAGTTTQDEAADLWNRRASPPAREEAPAETTDCKTCAGNGEIVTNWDEYLSPPEGAPADHATADCPDCDGIGKVEAPAEGAGELDRIKRAIADGFNNGNEQYDEASETTQLRFDMAADAVLALRNRTSEPEAGAVILKGVGKTNGDGWKDTTTVGEIVFVWNDEKPSPYAPGQYPRIGNEGWSASTAQYDFTPASLDEVRALYTHPAPATADKLRVAKEALEPFARAAGKLDGLWAEDDWRWNDSVRSNVTVRNIRRAAQAIAALNEQPQ